MAFRLLRICSTETICEERLEELKQNFLIPRVIDGVDNVDNIEDVDDIDEVDDI